MYWVDRLDVLSLAMLQRVQERVTSLGLLYHDKQAFMLSIIQTILTLRPQFLWKQNISTSLFQKIWVMFCVMSHLLHDTIIYTSSHNIMQRLRRNVRRPLLRICQQVNGLLYGQQIYDCRPIPYSNPSSCKLLSMFLILIRFR